MVGKYLKEATESSLEDFKLSWDSFDMIKMGFQMPDCHPGLFYTKFSPVSSEMRKTNKQKGSTIGKDANS